MEFTGKFWGPEEILEVNETEMETHRGVKIVEVVTQRQGAEEGTRKRTTTLTGLELVASDEAKDWNYVVDTRLEEVVRQTMNVCTDLGMDGSEMQPFINRLSMSLGNRLDHAAHIKVEGNDAEFVPGGNIYNDWSLAKAEHIIVHSKDEQST